MKKLLLSAVFALVFAAGASAQDTFGMDSVATPDDIYADSAAVYMEERDLSGKPLLEAFISGFNNVEVIKQEMKSKGVDCDFNFHDDTSLNELQLLYDIKDTKIFKAIDAENYAVTSLTATFRYFHSIDPTDETANQLLSEMSAEGMKLHYYFFYTTVGGDTYYKDALVTPADMRRIATAVQGLRLSY